MEIIRQILLIFGLSLHGLGIGIISSNFKPKEFFDSFVHDYAFYPILLGAFTFVMAQLKGKE